MLVSPVAGFFPRSQPDLRIISNIQRLNPARRQPTDSSVGRAAGGSLIARALAFLARSRLAVGPPESAVPRRAMPTLVFLRPLPSLFPRPYSPRAPAEI